LWNSKMKMMRKMQLEIWMASKLTQVELWPNLPVGVLVPLLAYLTEVLRSKDLNIEQFFNICQEI